MRIGFVLLLSVVTSVLAASLGVAVRTWAEYRPTIQGLQRADPRLQTVRHRMRFGLNRARNLERTLAADPTRRAVLQRDQTTQLARCWAHEKELKGLWRDFFVARHSIRRAEEAGFIRRDPIAVWASVNYHRSVVLDARRSPREKIRSLVVLRVLRSAGARNDGVVRTMVDLLQTSADAEIRRDIVTHLADVDSERVVTALVEHLLHDPNVGVRAKCAEDLWKHRDKPIVQDSLRLAARIDTSRRVRHYSERSLVK